MLEDKEGQIIKELKRRAETDIKFGKIVVEFIIHQGKISSAEILEQRVKLG